MITNAILKQEDALDQYLESLLRENTNQPNVSPSLEQEEHASTTSNLNEGEHPVTPNDTKDAHSAPPLDIKGGRGDFNKTKTSTNPNVPEWAAQPFECHQAQVAGITIAIPSNKLKGFLEYSNNITSDDKADEAIIGQTEHQDNQITVIDTAKLLFGNGYQKTSDHPPHNMLVISGTKLALACDNIAETIEIDPDQVRWRKGSTKIPWYAGIITAQKCAILDIDAIIQRFSS